MAKALELYRDLGSALGEANSLNDLADAEIFTGQYEAAITHLTRALELYRALDSQFGIANVLHDLGKALKNTGRYREAAVSLNQSLDIFRSVDDRLSEGRVLNDIGEVARLTGSYGEAEVSLIQALELTRSLNALLEVSESLNSLGFLSLDSARPGAETLFEEALTISRSISNGNAEARAIEGLGRYQLQYGRPDQAEQLLNKALALYEILKSPRIEIVAALMSRHGLVKN
jgi:tetratricopeptide (TPR) repeat protein